jgi:thiol-disulfide isomerase/thioredoxin
MSRGARTRGLLFELLVVVALIGGVHAWRARDLLPTDERTPAPPLSLRDLEGRNWSTAELAGRPAVIYFFAPWCKVCSASAPQLDWFHRWRGDHVAVLLVGLDWSSTAELREYASRHEVSMPVLAGLASTAADWKVRGYPTYYVLDARGRIAARDVGFTTAIGLWLRTLGT